MDWFISLPSGHITSFQQLSQLFREQYLANRAPPPVSYDLFDVKQYQGESLKEYINRFGSQVVKVGTTEEPMIVYAFRKGVCPNPFCESIIRNRPRLLLKFGVGQWNISPPKDRCSRSEPASCPHARGHTRGFSPSGSTRQRREGRSQRRDAPMKPENPNPGVQQEGIAQSERGQGRRDTTL